ncbi:predicted protein [Streptomyces viridochromogenes DSM 40736]|uniref:Predicted protein n=1 Tax=Streptomyces viridochromogenes (strain DSM 40736 / JCM 4977 / BCRC 1201 / Tue 494) TaxID=591159 RepID=D9X4W2_STRVT|nr:predicted protein [Streptomyces viridochromogenes DSM 40736]
MEQRASACHIQATSRGGEAAVVPRHRVGVDPAWDRGVRTGAWNDCRFGLGRQACPVSKREILPSSSTVKLQRVRISPQVSLA